MRMSPRRSPSLGSKLLKHHRFVLKSLLEIERRVTARVFLGKAQSGRGGARATFGRK
jgi:hypothetical protein